MKDEIKLLEDDIQMRRQTRKDVEDELQPQIRTKKEEFQNRIQELQSTK